MFARLRQWNSRLEHEYGPKPFHAMESRTKLIVGILVNVVRKQAQPPNMFKLANLPYVQFSIVVIAGALGFVLSSRAQLSPAAWTGVLAIDATVTLGLMAILTWLVKPFIQVIPEFLDEAIKRDIYDRPDALGDRQLGDLAKDEIENDPSLTSGTLISLSKGAIYFLSFLVCVLPIGLVVPQQWRATLLFFTSAWSVLVMSDFVFLIWWVGISKSWWAAYDSTKVDHDKYIEFCSTCKKNEHNPKQE